MVAWFTVIATLGIVYPEGAAILHAVNPLEAARFLGRRSHHFHSRHWRGVFLALTGGEALYADMAMSTDRESAAPGSAS